MSRFRRGRPKGHMRSTLERGAPCKFHPGYGLQYWLASDRGVTLASTVVSALADQGYSGHSVSQSTDARRPLYVANGVNGLPTIRFDGVDDLMVSASFTTNQPSRVFLSMKMVAAQAAGTNHDTVWSRGPTPFFIIDSTPRSILGAGSNISQNAVIADGVWARVELVLDGASGAIIVNGSSVASGDVGSGAGGILTIGSLNSGTTHSTNVEFQELFEIAGRLGASELARIRNRLKARIGV